MSMQRMLVKATITDTDTEQGTFRAVISTASIDRDGDIVEPAAMVSALNKWAMIGKLVPLAWDHSKEVIGHVEPASAEVVNKEVITEGYIDRTIERGQEAWRLAKSGTLSFSYGFLFDPKKGQAAKRPGGGFHIKELDVFEISAVPIAPANNETRVLEWKSLDQLKGEAERVAREVERQAIPDRLPLVPDPEPEPEPEPEPTPVKTLDELKSEMDRAALEVEQQAIPENLPPVEAPPSKAEVELQEVKSQLVAMRQELEDLKTKQADETDKATESRSVDPLRRQADAVALEVASGDVVLPPIKSVAPSSVPELSLKELRKKMRNEMLGVLSGGSSEQVREA
jgi:hypothetical protein